MHLEESQNSLEYVVFFSVVAILKGLVVFILMQLVATVLDRFDFDKDGALNYTEFATLMRDTGMDLTGS